jgi:hypothetical protein
MDKRTYARWVLFWLVVGIGIIEYWDAKKRRDAGIYLGKR